MRNGVGQWVSLAENRAVDMLNGRSRKAWGETESQNHSQGWKPEEPEVGVSRATELALMPCVISNKPLSFSRLCCRSLSKEMLAGNLRDLFSSNGLGLEARTRRGDRNEAAGTQE